MVNEGLEVGEWSGIPLAPEGKESSGLRNWDEMLPLAGEKTVGIVRRITPSTGGFEKGNLVEMASSRLQAMREQTRLARQDPTLFKSV
jgi:hypothetical protein